MLKQQQYHHPYIPRSTRLAPTAPYVGGELEALTSSTPFYRGQGIPIYEPAPMQCQYHIGGAHYGSAAWKNLKSGDENANVKLLQQKLIAEGFPMPKYGADGEWGSETTSALTAFQTEKGLNATGKMDDATFMALTGKALTEEQKKAAKKEKTSEAIWEGVGSLFTGFGKGFASSAGTSTGGTVNITTHQAKGMSTGAKVGLAIGGALLVGGLFYFAAKD